jgi:hypothetical protein
MTIKEHKEINGSWNMEKLTNKRKKEEQMKSSGFRTLTFVLMALAVLMVPGMAMAIGTPAGTPVSNSAQLTYTVGVSPTVYTATQTSTFVVDFEVNFSVANQDGGNVGVVAGQTNVYQTYVIQNDSNGILGFNLEIYNVPDAAIPADITTFAIWIDSDESGAFEGAGFDTLYTAGDVYDVGSTAGAGVTNTVFIVADVPAGAAANDFDTFHLIAQATDEGDPGTVKANVAGNLIGTMETQLAEGVGTVIFGGAADAAPPNGYHSDSATFTVGSANVVLAKDVLGVVWDPVVFNSANAKAIPGAYVEYRLTVSNLAPASVSAFLTTIADTLDGNTALTSYWNDFTTPSAPASTIGPIIMTGCSTGGQRACDGAGVTSHAGPVSNMNMATGLMAAEGTRADGELAVGDTVYIHYMVVIQ